MDTTPTSKPWQFSVRSLFVFIYSIAGVFCVPYVYQQETDDRLFLLGCILLAYIASVIFLNRGKWIILFYLGAYALCLTYTAPPSGFPRSNEYTHVRRICSRISFALDQYEMRYRQMPPRVVRDKAGKPLYSWRVLLLPYLGENSVYQNFHLDEPWDSPNNIQLLQFSSAFSGGGKQRHTNVLYIIHGESSSAGQAMPMRSYLLAEDRSLPYFVYYEDSEIYWSEPNDFFWPPSISLTTEERNGKYGPQNTSPFLKYAHLAITLYSGWGGVESLSSGEKKAFFQEFQRQGIHDRQNPIAGK